MRDTYGELAPQQLVLDERAGPPSISEDEEPQMAHQLVISTIVHQPRRLKLPAQPIPQGASIEDMTRCLFDEALNERYFHQVATHCYYPATECFLSLVRQGLQLSICFSLSFLRQAEAWDPALLDRFKELVAEPNVELIGVEPYQSFLFLFDLPRFSERMRWMRIKMEHLFGKRPRVTDTTAMCMSAPLYAALDQAGFTGALLDGRPGVLGWRDATHLYHAAGNLKLLPRHLALSDDVGYRFSNRSWDRWPLQAAPYARWLCETRGDFVLLGWGYETFGEHHRRESGILAFLQRLPEELQRRGVHLSTPSALLTTLEHASFHLPLPGFPTTWAGSGGLDFFLGTSAQQALFHLMLHVYGVARLTENPDVLDLALWLAQPDHLHLIQWFGRNGAEADVSASFTPREWWELGPTGILREQQQVYLNVLQAMEPYLPGKKSALPTHRIGGARGAPWAEPGIEMRF